MTRLHMDFETFSDVPIQHGLDAYMASKAFEVAMVAWTIDNGPGCLTVYEEGEQTPTRLDAALRNPEVMVYAFNAAFERAVLRVMGYDLPPSRFRCVMVKAFAHGFKGGLADVQEQIGMTAAARKSKTGHKLMLMFSKPAANENVYRYNRFTHPAEWEQYKEYGRQDVIAERALLQWLEQYPENS